MNNITYKPMAFGLPKGWTITMQPVDQKDIDKNILSRFDINTGKKTIKCLMEQAANGGLFYSAWMGRPVSKATPGNLIKSIKEYDKKY